MIILNIFKVVLIFQIKYIRNRSYNKREKFNKERKARRKFTLTGKEVLEKLNKISKRGGKILA